VLSRDDNELLCRIGPGTPMGNLMRQYWIPAALSSELPDPDGSPLRVRLLGESLIAFRASSGAVGLIQNSCPHRGASLFYGRNEADGLRCVYHGWKFDVAGRCVDMPIEPVDSTFKQKIRARAYPCVERGGLVWAYLGPRATPPPMPELEATMLAGSNIQVYQRRCNWMQALEGDVDTGHTVYLHLGSVDASEAPPGTWARYALSDRAPRYEVTDTEFGVMYGARRPAESDTEYWRIANFLFPFYAMVPTGVLGLEIRVRAWVPMDDGHTLAFLITHGAPPPARTAGRQVVGPPETLPNTTDWYGRFRRVADDNQTLGAPRGTRGAARSHAVANSPRTATTRAAAAPARDAAGSWATRRTACRRCTAR
jgi:phthalate 4,5-dioxygenase oxygenase subunit